MRSIIFARTRWNYQSYTDFWRLVELSGFPICYVDEIDLNADVVYIVTPMNGEMHDKFKYENLSMHRAKLLLWNIERPGGSGGLNNYVASNAQLSYYFHKVLVSDMALARHCNDLSDNRYFQYVTLGLHADLGQPGSYEDKKYDLIHLSCYSYHRARMFSSPSVPKSSYLGCSVATNGWGETRHELLQQSRFMYAVHQDEFPYIEPLRYNLAVAYGLPIIAQYSYDTYPYGNICTMLDEDDVHKYVQLYSKRMYEHTLDTRAKMMQWFQFRVCLESAMLELEL